MNRVKGLCFALVLSVAVNVSSIVSLIAERSEDKVQLTVDSGEVFTEDFAPTVYYLQRITGKEANAYPIGGDTVNAKKWKVILE